ncbi:response regulator [Alishewanella sp. d11]|uniref:response regulator n=1 Tax=Alishewanella sp. d11 TaxID=3414030 RepID=UPI003BF7E4B0
MRILLVEDHPSLAESLISALEKAGFTLDHASRLAQAKQFLAQTEYDLLILDRGLPDGDGLSVLLAKGVAGTTPVIMLTAKDQLDDRIRGLDAGADDYIVKPVEMSELIARCRAVLRRPGERSAAALSFADLHFDLNTRAVTVAQQPLLLSRRELSLLESLMRAAGRVATRQVLEQAIYNYSDEVGPNALEAAVSRLRKALVGSGCTIVTIRGVGWMLVEQEAH